MRTRTIIVTLAVALTGITATPSHALPAPAPEAPQATAAQAGLARWQRSVQRQVLRAARRQSLRIAFHHLPQGGELIDVYAPVTASSPRDIEVQGQVIWADGAGTVWLDWKHCYASLDFGGGDFGRPRVIHCSPALDRDWHRRRLG
jgi:hypothetical protein